MTGPVVVVGLGPAGPELTTAQAAAEIEKAETRFVRTTRHPAAAAVPDASSFDHLYEQSERIEDVYRGIVEALAGAAETGAVLYAVPGSPLVAERTVELLRADPRVDVRIVPGLSFVDLAWAALGIDPVGEGVRLVDGHRFAVDAAGQSGPLLVAQCDTRDVLSDVKLSVDEAPADPVVVLQRLGLADQHVCEVAWEDLDRAVDADHLTSLYIPRLAPPVGAELVRLWELTRTLRERCPWDREQTHESLVPYMLEEAYEAVEAIQSGDGDDLVEELGDVLFQVFIHSALGAEAGEFTVADVARGIHDKLVRRHPHVFGSVEAGTADQVVTNWQKIKQEEKGRESVVDGIPAALPALIQARKVQSRAASVGFDWDELGEVFAKVAEELEEIRSDPSAEEVGDLLFAVVNLSRHVGHDPEAALLAATAKFRRRFREVERLAASRRIDMAAAGLAALDALWDEVKRGE